MTINKKLATILLGVGISLSTLNVSANAPTGCYEFRDWCVNEVRELYPNNWWTTDHYNECLLAYDDCVQNGGWG